MDQNPSPKEQRILSIDKQTLPKTYVQNSEREQLLLDYANAFETQFLSQFPKRKPIYMVPLNEAGIQKFLPTTLRPALLADPTLSNGQKLAQFVADAVNYEQLKDATSYSRYVMAPQTTLEWQKGDSIDISLLLCSLLLGAGFNAYVCLGTADRRLTEQLRHKEVCPELDCIKEYADNLLNSFASESAFSQRYRPGLFQVQNRYCRHYDDFLQIEQEYKAEEFVNLLQFKPAKEFSSLSLRPTLKEMIPNININTQEQELLNVSKLVQNQPQMKNQFGFSKIFVLDQGETKNAEYKSVLSGGGMFLSADNSTYGGNLVISPDGTEVFKNKFLRKRPIVNISKYEEMKKMRMKMEKIGAKALEVEAYTILQMKEQGKMDDILVPGETGQAKRTEEIKTKKQLEEQDKNHLKELYQDILDGQRVYSWVYVAPLQDEKLSYNDAVENDINTLISQLDQPSKVKSGMFIDAVSGRVFTLNNSLFKGIDSVFNNENYFVNLQVDQINLKTTSYNLYDIDKWCICVMTQQLIKIRQQQQQYQNKAAVQDRILKQVGGNNQYMSQYKNNTGTIEQGTNLPSKINKIIDKKLDQMKDQQYQQSLAHQTQEFVVSADEQPPEPKDLYEKRWDSVKPVRILMSALPVPWPVQTTLSELKLQQSYPLREKLENEKVSVQYLPEKTYLFSDSFVRLFNKFSQRNGCTALITTRPRPVYRSVFDEDGDCVKNILIGWRFQRIQMFQNRNDKLSLRMVQFEIAHADVEVPLNADKYKQLNEGYEIITQLDLKTVAFCGKQYPLWCFCGEDLDEFSDADSLTNKQQIFSSYSNDIICKVKQIKQVFNENRQDQMKMHEILPNGQRKLQFYENREDYLGQIIITNKHIIEKFYDYLRADGLQERVLVISDTPSGAEEEIKFEMNIIEDNTYKQVDRYAIKVTEKFRDMGQIQQAINSRRRRFIRAKQVIEDAEVKFVSGQQKSEEKMSYIDQENQYVDLDSFQEIEYALTLAAYQIFVAQKQIFSSNVSSTTNPLYSIQQGTQSIIRRHNNLLMQAYNLCPDKELQEQSQKQQSFTEKENTLEKSNISKSEIDESHTIDDEATHTGQFWHRSAKVLKQQNSQVTTDFLRQDISELTKQKAHMQLPKNLATLNNNLTKQQLTENEMRKQIISTFAGVKPNYFEPELNNVFNNLEYVQTLKKREMPILPQFRSAPLAYSYVKQFMKEPIRISSLQYDQTTNNIRLVCFNDAATLFQKQKLFDKNINYVHRNAVFAHSSEIQTRLISELSKRLQDAYKLILQQKKPLQILAQKPAMMFQCESQMCSVLEDQKTTGLQTTDEFVQLSNREKSLHAQLMNEHKILFELINAVETLAETKICSQVKGGSLNIYQQNKGEGLQFRPRDLLMARHALEQHGTMERFSLKTEVKLSEQKKVNGNDPLLPFIKEAYRQMEVLPKAVAQQVFDDAMKAMKDRILERTGHIQSRLQAETEQLKRRNKNLEQLNPEEKEKVMKEIKESIFRISIIEMRTQKHIQDGTERYAEYARELKKDPRLKML
ncbi:Conserved_hypothetical protein [Hexamita inflata]|uniref:Uncharacterized protein n=1 Tax=Hexamita inflata TaxID=28002 RepID=A0AA86QZJ9_9EUKA|nr:Conserved hypothetical protein [Hexamita inflata]